MKQLLLFILILLLSGCFDIPAFVITPDDGTGNVNPNPITSQFYDTTLAYVVNLGDTISFKSSKPTFSYSSMNNSSWQFFGYYGETSFTGTSYNPAKTLIYSLSVSQDLLLFAREFNWEEFPEYWTAEQLEAEKNKNWKTLIEYTDTLITLPDSIYNYTPVPFPVELDEPIPFFIHMDDGSWTFRMIQDNNEMIINSVVGPLFFGFNFKSDSFQDYLLELKDEISHDPLPIIREFIAKEKVIEEYYDTYNFDSTAHKQGYLIVE